MDMEQVFLRLHLRSVAALTRIMGPTVRRVGLHPRGSATDCVSRGLPMAPGTGRGGALAPPGRTGTVSAIDLPARNGGQPGSVP